MELSMRWAARCRATLSCRATGYGLFGIVQGGVFPDSARRSAEALMAIGFDGYAHRRPRGGRGAGGDVCDARGDRRRMLPADQPRYLMGVGTPDDLLGAVRAGIDMFDCVMPTRAGRTARAFTSRGRAQSAQRAVRGRSGRRSIPACACPACTRHSRGLSAPSVPGRGDAGADAADLAQSDLLPGPDGGLRAALFWPATLAAYSAEIARRLDSRGPMTEQPYEGLTQLGQPARPASGPRMRCWSGCQPACAGAALCRALHRAGIHLAVPDDRPAGFRPYRASTTCPATGSSRASR